MEALLKGTAHIELQDHIDLAQLDFLQTQRGFSSHLNETTKTIRGNCHQSRENAVQLPSGSVTLQQQDQCVIAVNGGLFELTAHSMWLDRLHVQVLPALAPSTVLAVSHARLWMTNVTIQGSAPESHICDACVSFEATTSVFAEGCTFAHLGAHNIIKVGLGTLVSMKNCNFMHNRIIDNRPHDGAVVSADMHGTSASTGISGSTQVRLQGCTFHGNTPRNPLLQELSATGSMQSQAFSSDPPFKVHSCSEQASGCSFKSTVPLREEAECSGFLCADDEWLKGTQQDIIKGGVQTLPPVTGRESNETAASPEPTSSLSHSPTDAQTSLSLPVAGSVAGVLLLAACIVVALLVVRRRRSSQRNALLPTHQPHDRSQHAPAACAVGDDIVAAATLLFDSSIPPSSHRTRVPRLVPPSADLAHDNSPAANIQHLHQQVDTFGSEHTLAGRYELLSSSERFEGGQGVVQMACGKYSGKQFSVAIKFFARRHEFKTESAFYQRWAPLLKSFMPTLVEFVGNEDGTITDPLKAPVPPFVVLERGHSLKERMQHAKVDPATAAHIFGHVSQRIAELHSAGYVHRDLKPGNILRLPRSGMWVLIDFGITAEIGQQAPVGFTAPYAAPETALANQNGCRTVTATAAMDVWALGVIVLEMLLGHSAFAPFNGAEQIIRDLADPNTLLPWEKLTESDTKKLGCFLRPIQNLLQRDPSERWTAKEFHLALKGSFAP